MLIDYINVFITGGLICMLGQLLINYTKMTSSRILVTFLMLGLLLEAFGVYQYIVNFGGAGATVPIVGFGSSLARGAIEGVSTDGLLGALTGGLRTVAGGLSAAITFGFIIALIFKPKTKT